MHLLRIMICLLLLSPPFFASAQKEFKIVEQTHKKQVDILFNGKLLTAYCYYDSSFKPMLFPVNTVDGITVTRGYPLQPVAGERTDHPHHTGIWLNYESVNGLDFWNNSTAIAPEKRAHYGTIVHNKIMDKKVNGNEATLTTSASWKGQDGKILLNEKTTFYFRVSDNNFFIDRTTQLTAADTTVVFKDVKDGMFAIRVARELEMPSKDASSFVDDKGNITTVAPSDKNVTGMYYASNGAKGDSVWSSKGEWAKLTGKKENKDITIGIIDHPANTGYPAYWHARGYGLFAINPLGRKVFSKGAEELSFSLTPMQSATFRYRVVIASGSTLSAGQMDKFSVEFAKK